MKKILAMSLMLIGLTVSAQEDNPNYDKSLADSLGADEYGMKQYVLVILKTGTNVTADQDTTNKVFAGHMENIGRLAKEGKLIVAGPLGKNDKTYRGIFILNVKTLNEARELVATDPAVKEKLLDAEFYNWYGSAALPEYLKSDERIRQKKY